MSKKLSWNEIKREYNQQWVELINYSWPDGMPNPIDGVVRVHAEDRKEFHRLMEELEPQPEDSALVFVGTPKVPGDSIYFNPQKYSLWK